MVVHRRGGKVSMTLALSPSLPQGLLSNLIIADVSPRRGKLSPDFMRYADAMIDIQEGKKAKSRKEAFKLLESVEPVCDVFNSSFPRNPQLMFPCVILLE